jgi:COG4 transport protein
LYYITALTALFESVAMIVDQHQPVVEKYYGSGKMASVIERLLDECDRVVKKLIDGWEDERSMKRKVSLGASTSCIRYYQHLLAAKAYRRVEFDVFNLVELFSHSPAAGFPVKCS